MTVDGDENDGYVDDDDDDVDDMDMCGLYTVGHGTRMYVKLSLNVNNTIFLLLHIKFQTPSISSIHYATTRANLYSNEASRHINIDH